MEESKRQLSVEELFRQKLENSEVIPEASVNDDLMRKLGRKEFMRFNPGRFNIYYLGLITAGLITAGLLLISGPRSGENRNIDEPVNNETSPAPAGSEVKPKVISPTGESAQKIISAEESKSEKVSGIAETGPASAPKSEAPPVIAGISSPVPKVVLTEKSEPAGLQAKSPEPALFIPSANTGCAPLKVAFGNIGGGYSKFKWTFGDGGMSDQREPEWIYEDEGEYRATLNATDANGKTSTWSVLITVYPKPEAQFEISPEKAVLPIDEIRFTNYSSGAKDYRWEFGDGKSSTAFEPVHKYVKFGKYDVRLVAVSEHGCSDTLLLKDAFSGSDYFINMPNAFIPNPYGPSGGQYSLKSDETAEIFHPEFSGVDEYQLRIFSKTGILIFESNDINIGWDGYFKGELCNPGVYVWKLRGNFSSGEPFTRQGDVTLIKK